MERGFVQEIILEKIKVHPKLSALHELVARSKLQGDWSQIIEERISELQSLNPIHVIKDPADSSAFLCVAGLSWLLTLGSNGATSAHALVCPHIQDEEVIRLGFVSELSRYLISPNRSYILKELKALLEASGQAPVLKEQSFLKSWVKDKGKRAPESVALSLTNETRPALRNQEKAKSNAEPKAKSALELILER